MYIHLISAEVQYSERIFSIQSRGSQVPSGVIRTDILPCRVKPCSQSLEGSWMSVHSLKIIGSI
jgi:hypothetical protein